ncbi:Uncharacterised protein [Klebsiella pneumoniae]|nr:Uncharacterised protein [Klebsiella pneumoniae]
MNQRKHVGALREFDAEQVSLSIRHRQFVDHIAAVQNIRAVFDDAHIVVPELQRISLDGRELERDKAAFSRRIFGFADEARARAILHPAILTDNKVVALAQRHLIL